MSAADCGDDILESCRVCLKKNTKMTCIFRESKLANKIEFCTGISLKKEAGFPSQICKNCLRNLSIAHKFKTTCIISEKMLQSFIDVKLEIDGKEIGENCKMELKLEDELDDLSNCGSENGIDDAEQLKTEPDEVEQRNESSSETVSIKQRDTQKQATKRGPYNKRGPIRLKKLKYSKLACEPCGIKFTDKIQSDEHKLMHKEEPWICEICGKSFGHRSSLHAHVSSHTRVFSCAHCDYGTGNKFDLIKHMHIHLGLKRFKCSVCPSVYRTSSSLSDHVRRAHLRLRPHACHLCERAFFDRTKLNRHVDSHFDLKRFECDICHACFSRRWYWKKHLEKQHDVVVPPKRPGRQRTTVI